jgi:toxin ParE1/3/4
MKVRWSKTALIELDSIFLYIAERNRTAARSVVRHIEALVSQLEQFPRRGHFTDEPDAWALSVVRYPYVILYAIDVASDEVVILHIRHTAREQSPAED